MTFDDQVELRLSALLADRPADLCQLALQLRREIAKAAGD